MLNLLFWLVFGLLAGWVNAQVSGQLARRQLLEQMLAGVIGSLAGGLLVIGKHTFGTYNGTSILTAAITAVIFAGISSYIISRNTR